MVRTAPPRCSTGVAGLDNILNGGLLADRLYLLDGNPGAGKTTLALQFLQEGVRLGQKTLYVTLSESANELRDGAQSHGWTMDGIEIVELHGDGSLPLDDELTIFHPTEIELSETTRQVVAAVERLNPSRMVFDSLSEFRLLAQSPLRYRRQILALKQFFSGRACTTLLLDDRTSEGADLQLQSIAHGVISLEHVAPPYGRTLRSLRVIKFRGSDFRSGFHHMRLVRGGLEVYPRLAASEHGEAFERVQIASGVTALDALLGGGVEAGTSTLVVGPAGSGKTTIALQYARAAIERGEHAEVFSFDESKASMEARMATLGMPVAADGGAGLQLAFSQLDPAEITPGQFANLVRVSVERNRARVIVIDSLNGYTNAMVDGQYLTAQLHELVAYLNNHGVCSFLIAAQSGMIAGQMLSPGNASYLADNVIYTRFFEHAGKVKKAISVLKKRGGPHEETIRELSFSSQGLHLSKPLDRFRGILTGVPIEIPATDGLHDEA